MASAPILINERNGNVALLRRDNAGMARAHVADHGRWPAWSPDGQLVVRSTIVEAAETGRAVIAVSQVDGAGRALVHEGAPGVLAFIAPNVPHYSLWGPGG